MRDLGLLILRLILGGVFLAHGAPKLLGGPDRPPPQALADKLGPGFVTAWQEHGGPAWASRLEALGVPMPGLMAWVTGLIECIGSLCLVVGWLTRPFALALAIEMAVAIQRVHWKNGLMVSRGGYEFNLTLIGALIALLTGGPGRLSVDGE